jgi:acetolactate synthase-1/2/3 large subunit
VTTTKKYADVVMDWLAADGYTHCFFVAGGNSMHLLDGARRTMICIPFVHEVSAGIAAEYFNEVQSGKRAFVLVTAGPGLTNCLTAMAGAFLESRDLLVLGGQVKSTDLATDGLRQRGIQEIDGVALATPVVKHAKRLTQPIEHSRFMKLVQSGRNGRKGPVFIEICLDVQGAPFGAFADASVSTSIASTRWEDSQIAQIRDWLKTSSRPVLLIGGGVSRNEMKGLLPLIEVAGIPVMTTWNGADRVGADHPMYFGRPNTWGQRSSNVLIQQSDLVIAAGTRLGMQQTGFNWQSFVPSGRVVQIDLDNDELEKGHPKIDLGVRGDASGVVKSLLKDLVADYSSWIDFCRDVRELLPSVESANSVHEGFVNPYSFVASLSAICNENDIVVPCSSGGAFTVMMQAFENKTGQIMVTNKGLASMGYGLAGAIGASLTDRKRRTILVEGDGGFSQNLQELATVSVNALPVKSFIFANEGYASIRMTQRNYFEGQYLGCDTKTGLGFPDWKSLARAYGIPYLELSKLNQLSSDNFKELWESDSPAMFAVKVHPEQTYYPKITSRVTATGGMESAPLHLMTPELEPNLAKTVFRYIK